MPSRRTVLVLGASRGLGAAISAGLAAAGFPVAVGCRSAAAAEAVAATLAGAGGRALPVVVDVADMDSVQRAADRAAQWAGGLHGIVNNAGIIEPIARLAETDAAAWARLIEVNLVGAYHGIRAALPHLTKAGGAIVNISSGAAGHPMEGWSAYCASKAAVAMLTRSIAHEYGSQGVLSFGYRPGVVDTDMQGLIRASGLNPVSQLPREKLAKPDAAARGITWLFDAMPADLSGSELDIRDETFQQRMAIVR